MMNIKVNGNASAELAALLSRVNNTFAVMKAWGVRMRDKAKANAKSRTKGGGFWTAVADSIRIESVTASSVNVEASHIAAAQKQYGGVIRAKHARALTIPVDRIAYGKRAKEVAMDLGQPLFRPKGTDVLAVSDLGSPNGIRPLFVLRTSVRQNPEPFFPDAEYGLAEAFKLIRRQLKMEGAA